MTEPVEKWVAYCEIDPHKKLNGIHLNLRDKATVAQVQKFYPEMPPDALAACQPESEFEMVFIAVFPGSPHDLIHVVGRKHYKRGDEIELYRQLIAKVGGDIKTHFEVFQGGKE